MLAGRIDVLAGMGGRGVVRVGLLGRSGAGTCPNLLQRRSGPGSAAMKKRGISTFLFRRFGVIGAFATDLDKRCRRGPLRGRRSRRSPRRSGRPTPPRAPKRAFCTRAGTSNCTSRRAQDRPARTAPHRPRSAPPRTGPGPRTTAPGEKGSIRLRGLVRTRSRSRVVSHADPSGPVGGADPGPARDRSCPAAKEGRP